MLLKEKYSWDRLLANAATILSIHNLGYGGLFEMESVYKAGLSYDNYYPGGPYEFYEKFGFLKAGIVVTDMITTVSQTYALEIQTPEYGAGLEGVLAKRHEDIRGVINGIDTKIWSHFSTNIYHIHMIRLISMTSQSINELCWIMPIYLTMKAYRLLV